MFKLDFKASNLRNAEKEYNLAFFEAIMRIGQRQISATDLMFLYACGGATAEDFDKDFRGGMQNTVINIFEAVDEAGFLGQDLDIQAMKEAFGVTDKKENDSSTKSGKATKA